MSLLAGALATLTGAFDLLLAGCASVPSSVARRTPIDGRPFGSATRNRETSSPA